MFRERGRTEALRAGLWAQLICPTVNRCLLGLVALTVTARLAKGGQTGVTYALARTPFEPMATTTRRSCP